MRIAVATFGSEGDVRPYVALAKRLRREGEDAYLVAPALFAARAREHGVPFVPSGPAWEARDLDGVLARVIAAGNPMLQGRVLFRGLLPFLLDAVPHELEALRGADLVVHHHFDLPAFAAAVKLEIPRVGAELFHSTLRYGVEMPNAMRLGRPIHLATSALLRRGFVWTSQAVCEQVLAAAGVPVPKRAFIESGEGGKVTLLAVSPSFVPPEPTWGERVVETGYWFLDVEGYQPPAKLAAFLEAGPPPVAITFGSMIGADGRAHTRELLAAIVASGHRAILQAGWGGLGEGEALPDGVLRVEHVPHDWLFPRAACVVHHGGGGTTAAALRAGVPQIIVWHLGDQPVWGELAWRRGLSPARTVPQHRLSAKWLSKALRRLAGDRSFAERAKAMGERIRAEDGTGRAVEAIRRAMG